MVKGCFWCKGPLRAHSIPVQNWNIHRAKAATQDRLSIQALTSAGVHVATSSNTVLKEMQSKHLQASHPNLPSGPIPPPSLFSNRWSSVVFIPSQRVDVPGPSGFCPSHLGEAVTCPSPDQASQLLSSLTRCTNLLAAGQILTTISPHLCGASLLACRKRSGSHHPIAVGEVLRRLISKCLTFHSLHLAVSPTLPSPAGCWHSQRM